MNENEINKLIELLQAMTKKLDSNKVLSECLKTITELKDALEDMVIQFAYYSSKKGGSLWTGGLSTLKVAFNALGWKEPHPYWQRACAVQGCSKEATCGTIDKNHKYVHVCGFHSARITIEEQTFEYKQL